MNSSQRASLVLAAVALGLASLFCTPPHPDQDKTEDFLDTEDVEIRSERATMFAEGTATGAADEATKSVELTRIAGQSEEEVKATLYAEEACIVKDGEGYTWEYTGFDIVEGSYSTVCEYNFVVRNTSDQDQILIFHETFDNGSDRGGDGVGKVERT